MTSDEQAQSGHDETTDAAPRGPTVVGLGASAGGLKALERFFDGIPADSGLAFVVVVHLSPDHVSELPALLQRHVDVPVAAVHETVPLEANRIYVIPPGHNLEALDTHLRVTELEESRIDRSPIDHFFRTLARTHEGNSVAVVLTGTGSDGASGITAVKECGGITIVQDPADAEHSGMPDSAIATGFVDLVLPIEEISVAILRLTSIDPRIEVGDVSTAASDDEAQFQQLLARVRSVTGRNFSRYRRATLVRRVQRRMRLQHLTDLASYLDQLEHDTEEVVRLADDILITVSSFFRDRATFDRLATLALPDIFRGKSSDDEVRVWSAGCASGEEAYTLAMLLIEEADRHVNPPKIQVFATDLHDGALVRARHGYFAADISSDVSPDRLDRFFRPVGTGHQIRDEIRQTVVFAPHDLLADPPFSDLDLVSCRNLLIYLGRTGQDDAIATFRYALRPGGWLLLGSSERTNLTSAFELVDADHCLYRRRPTPARAPRLDADSHTGMRVASVRPPVPRPATAGVDHGAIHAVLVQRYAPSSILISPDDHVVHLSPGAGRWLLPPAGDMTTRVFKLMPEPLAAELRAAIQGVRDNGTPVRTQIVRVPVDGNDHGMTLDVQTGDEAGAEGYVLVLLNDLGPIRDEAGDPDDLRADAEHARDSALRRLQSVIEQHESGKEALQAANEELQSSNEELRSTLEELETSKEELQSMNEELRTLNQENHRKVDELARVTADLDNLLTSTQIPTIFVDPELRILRFTSAANGLFNLRDTDRGRPLSDITHRLGYDSLHADARALLEGQPIVEREVSAGERWYLSRLLPYRDSDGQVTGVVMTFVDITAQKRTERALHEMNEQLEQRVEAGTAQVRRLAASLSRAEHEERRRLSQILHDDLQQQLYGLQFKLDGVVTSLDHAAEDDPLAGRLTDLGERIGRIIDITRNLSVDLSPPLLAGDRLEDAITWLTPRMQEYHGVEVDVVSRGEAIRHGESDLVITLFQIARELLFNVAKHAHADRVTVSIDHTDHDILIVVADEGAGFDAAALKRANASGVGLQRARERLELLDGRLDVDSQPGAGTTVTVRVPVERSRIEGAEQP